MNQIHELLFHTPWWLPAGIALLGIVLFITGNNRREFRIRTAGMVVVLVAVVLSVVSYLVDTDLERAVNRSRELTRSVERHDWAALRNILDPRTSLGVLGARNVYANRDAIVNGAQQGVEVYGLHNIRILSLDSRQDGTLITITMDVLTEQDRVPQTLPSAWQFDWEQSSNGIVLRRITCLRIGNAVADNARTHFPQR